METKTEQIVYYVMQECRCRITEDGLEYQTEKSSRGQRDSRVRICGEHGTRIKHRESNCSECGQLFEQVKCGQMSAFCPGCRSDHYKEIIKRRNRDKYLRKAGLSVVDHVDCQLFSDICKVCVYPVFPCSARNAKRIEAA
jgi:hypothetical protein